MNLPITLLVAVGGPAIFVIAILAYAAKQGDAAKRRRSLGLAAFVSVIGGALVVVNLASLGPLLKSRDVPFLEESPREWSRSSAADSPWSAEFPGPPEQLTRVDAALARLKFQGDAPFYFEIGYFDLSAAIEPGRTNAYYASLRADLPERLGLKAFDLISDREVEIDGRSGWEYVFMNKAHRSMQVRAIADGRRLDVICSVTPGSLRTHENTTRFFKSFRRTGPG